MLVRLTLTQMKLITRSSRTIDHAATGMQMRAARERAGVSLCDAAKWLDISAPYLSDLELGRRHCWTQDYVDSLETLYGKAKP